MISVSFAWISQLFYNIYSFFFPYSIYVISNYLVSSLCFYTALFAQSFIYAISSLDRSSASFSIQNIRFASSSVRCISATRIFLAASDSSSFLIDSLLFFKKLFLFSSSQDITAESLVSYVSIIPVIKRLSPGSPPTAVLLPLSPIIESLCFFEFFLLV